jgi:hypothetical protein
MPRAEAGSTKAIGNKIKAKGLGRLRWYCQACERQMRDENGESSLACTRFHTLILSFTGFKCHVASESHVRQMLLIGEDPRRHIQDFSREFQKNFVDLLKTTHGEKKVHINHFYQQVIADKEVSFFLLFSFVRNVDANLNFSQHVSYPIHGTQQRISNRSPTDSHERDAMEEFVTIRRPSWKGGYLSGGRDRKGIVCLVD